jgi:hypothetical protein
MNPESATALVLSAGYSERICDLTRFLFQGEITVFDAPV